ncbi:MAG: hypothetical protein KJ737_04965 [Proteobacteria bacterium]|nr:hypothetical protein [Pseudomonadota bacterium]
MNNIKTLWKFNQYQTLLDARWACMFDLLEWRYEYQPYNINGWVPTFALFGANTILVEVKPYTSLKQFQTAKLIQAIDGSPMENKEILLLGSEIFPEAEAFQDPAIGWIGEHGFADPETYEINCWFAYAVFNFNRSWGFFHEYGGYNDRMTGRYDGDGHLMPPDYKEVLELWNLAGEIINFLYQRKGEYMGKSPIFSEDYVMAHCKHILENRR